MASLPQSYYTAYTNLGRQQWTTLIQPANTYGNLLPWMNAATTGYGASAATQTASVQRTTQISGYSSLNMQGQQAVAAQGATIDLSDAVTRNSVSKPLRRVMRTILKIRSSCRPTTPRAARSIRPSAQS